MPFKSSILRLCAWCPECMCYGRDFAATPVQNIKNNVTTQKEIFALSEPHHTGRDFSRGPGQNLIAITM